jgi:hypothetical protein
LTFILSILAAVAGGYLAYINGYIINSNYDRPMHLPFFKRAVYLPVDLIIISVCSYVAVWIVFLILLFIIKGFGRSGSAKTKTTASSVPIAEETYVAGVGRIWRSS